MLWVQNSRRKRFSGLGKNEAKAPEEVKSEDVKEEAKAPESDKN